MHLGKEKALNRVRDIHGFVGALDSTEVVGDRLLLLGLRNYHGAVRETLVDPGQLCPLVTRYLVNFTALRLFELTGLTTHDDNYSLGFGKCKPEISSGQVHGRLPLRLLHELHASNIIENGEALF